MSEDTPQAQPEKRNLGRGLAALLGETEPDFAESHGPGGTRKLAVSQLRPGPVQPRRNFDDEALQALVDSVREKGILQPLLVRRAPDSMEKYQIIAGERRWRAAQMAGIHEVPVVLRDMSDAEALEVALVENIQRQDLTPLEEAEGYRRLMDEFSHSQADLGKAVGKSRSHVANMLRLLGLPEPVKQMVDDGSLSAGHARALLSADDAVGLARDVVRKGLNVRQTERLVARAKKSLPGKGMAKIAAKLQKDPNTLALERDLSGILGLAVNIDLKGEAGEITIQFDALEQLDDVLRRLKRAPSVTDTV
jgi:ParB family chromosome partitioning protein